MVAATNASVSNPNDIQELCGPKIRAATSGCQVASCNSEDQQKTNTLAEALCGPLYKINATLSSSVSSAIASASAAAIAATGGKDATNVANYPACAVSWLLLPLLPPRFRPF